jgi:hypothetical protein
MKKWLARFRSGISRSELMLQRGIGLVDAHLIASTFITPHTVLWSRDRRLRDVAHTLGLKANIS